MKKKKLSLQELKVKSFVTESGTSNEETIKGGAIYSFPNPCIIKTINGCPILTLQCPSRFICPSIVDGCPSTPGPCTITDPTTILTDPTGPQF